MQEKKDLAVSKPLTIFFFFFAIDKSVYLLHILFSDQWLREDWVQILENYSGAQVFSNYG